MKLGQFDKATLFASAARTASVNSDAEDVSGFETLLAWLNVTAVSGTSPTLDVKFQESMNGTDWLDIPSAAFTQTTANALKRLEFSTRAQFVRAVVTIGGTGPSFTFDLVISGKN